MKKISRTDFDPGRGGYGKRAHMADNVQSVGPGLNIAPFQGGQGFRDPNDYLKKRRYFDRENPMGPPDRKRMAY